MDNNKDYDKFTKLLTKEGSEPKALLSNNVLMLVCTSDTGAKFTLIPKSER